MGKLSTRRLAAAATGAGVGLATSLTGIFMWSVPLGLVLTGLVVTAAAVFLVRLDREEAR